MKCDTKATANTLAVIGGASYIICAFWTMVSRTSFMGIFGLWFHGVDLTALPYKQPEISGVIFGLITFTIASWLTGYFFAKVYNYFAK